MFSQIYKGIPFSWLYPFLQCLRDGDGLPIKDIPEGWVQVSERDEGSSWFSYLSRGTWAILSSALLAAINHLACLPHPSYLLSHSSSLIVTIVLLVLIIPPFLCCSSSTSYCPCFPLSFWFSTPLSFQGHWRPFSAVSNYSSLFIVAPPNPTLAADCSNGSFPRHCCPLGTECYATARQQLDMGCWHHSMLHHLPWWAHSGIGWSQLLLISPGNSVWPLHRLLISEQEIQDSGEINLSRRLSMDLGIRTAGFSWLSIVLGESCLSVSICEMRLLIWIALTTTAPPTPYCSLKKTIWSAMKWCGMVVSSTAPIAPCADIHYSLLCLVEQQGSEMFYWVPWASWWRYCHFQAI